MAVKDTFRIVTRGTDGKILIRDFESQDDLLKRHTQIGVDDCSTDLALRGCLSSGGLSDRSRKVPMCSLRITRGLRDAYQAVEHR